MCVPNKVKGELSDVNIQFFVCVSKELISQRNDKEEDRELGNIRLKRRVHQALVETWRRGLEPTETQSERENQAAFY